MARALDEPDAVYGLVARSAELARRRQRPSRFGCARRPNSPMARALTAEDVVFTFKTLKEKGHPLISHAADGREQGRGARPADRALHVQRQPDPRPAAGRRRACPCCPRPTTRTREFEQTTLEPPLGSGPYKIGDFKQGAFVTYRRRDDYWAKDLPVNRGRFNFDEVRYEYYPRPHGRAREPQGRRLRPARGVHRARLGDRLRHSRGQGRPADPALTLPDENPSGAQGFFLNTRRAKVRRRARAQGARSTPSTTSGPTRTCSTGSTRARRATSKTPT